MAHPKLHIDPPEGQSEKQFLADVEWVRERLEKGVDTALGDASLPGEDRVRMRRCKDFLQAVGDPRKTEQRVADSAAGEALEETFRPNGGELDQLGRDMLTLYRKQEQNPGDPALAAEEDRLNKRATLIAQAGRENLGKMSERGFKILGIPKEHFERSIEHIEKVSGKNKLIENMSHIEQATLVSEEHIQPRIEKGEERLQASAARSEGSDKATKEFQEGISNATRGAGQQLRQALRTGGQGMDEKEFAGEVISMLFVELPIILKPIFLFMHRGGKLVFNPFEAKIRTGAERRQKKRAAEKTHQEVQGEQEVERNELRKSETQETKATLGRGQASGASQSKEASPATSPAQAALGIGGEGGIKDARSALGNIGLWQDKIAGDIGRGPAKGPLRRLGRQQRRTGLILTTLPERRGTKPKGKLFGGRGRG